MSDDDKTTRLREAIAAARVRVQSLMEAEKWAELADASRGIARMERELALLAQPKPPGGNVVGRRFARG